jgi:hypothetical protein
MMKKFKKHRERNPGDVLCREFKALKKKANVNDAEFQKLLGKFQAIHVKGDLSVSKKFIEQQLESNLNEKEEAKLNFLQVCTTYDLKVSSDESYPLLEKYARLGWIRTVSSLTQIRDVVRSVQHQTIPSRSGARRLQEPKSRDRLGSASFPAGRCFLFLCFVV